MPEAYIVDAVRTPVGKRGGGLSQVHPADLGAHVLQALVERTGIDPAVVEDVVFGCVDAIGPQAGDIARTCWLAAGYPEEVPGTAVDFTDPDPFTGSKGWVERYGTQEVSQFRGAEMIAEKWGITREEMEQFALESHRRAAQATDEGRFQNEIVPLNDVTVDEGFRRETSLEKMASLKPLLPDGRLTAAVSSQISDAAAAMLVVSEAALQAHNLKPRARIHHLSVRGAD